MKPSENQKQLIRQIASEISGWENTNDIDSPSHWNLISEFCESLELDENNTTFLNRALEDIMTIIKQTK